MIVKPSTILVNPNADLQAAINALPAAGGEIVIPAVLDVTAQAPIQMRRGVHLTGQGWCGFTESTNGGPWDAPSVIKCTDPNKNIIEMNNAQDCRLRNLEIKGAGVAGTQIGIKATFGTFNGITFTNVPGHILDHVLVRACGSHGVQFDNAYISNFRQLICVANKGNGMNVIQTASGNALTSPNWMFDNCQFVDNVGLGFYAKNLQNCVFHTSSFQNSGGVSQCSLDSPNSVIFDACNFELIGNQIGNSLGLDISYGSGLRIFGGTFSAAADFNGRGMRLTATHHFDIDGITVAHLVGGAASAIKLANDGAGNSCFAGAIGNVNMPNQQCIVLEGTEGVDASVGDFYNVAAKYAQVFKDDATRDHALGVGYEQPLKLRGHMIFVGTPTSPATYNLQYWNGSAWVAVTHP